jgi:hypothetical protein
MNSTGAYSCDQCPSGRYQQQPGAVNSTSCQACPPSAPLSPPGSSSSLLCSIPVCVNGTFTSDLNEPCSSECPPGSSCYLGQRSLCPSGSYAPYTGMSACMECGVGRTGVKNGSEKERECMKCPLSSFSISAVSATCQLCTPGNYTTGEGSSSPANCTSLGPCISVLSWISEPSSFDASEISLCLSGAASPISLLNLLPGGAEQSRQFTFAANFAMMIEYFSSLAPFSADALTAAYTSYSPLKNAPSLREAAFGPDPTLLQYGASGASVSRSSTGEDDVSDGELKSSTRVVIIVCLIMAAIIPLIFYRLLPARVAVWIDLLPYAHKLNVGQTVKNSPTQLGAGVTLTFLLVSLLVSVLLATQPNVERSTELLPPSASSLGGTAEASWQVTIRAYSGERSVSDVSQWCNSSSPNSQSGFTLPFSRSFQITNSAGSGGQLVCNIRADCENCALAAVGTVSFQFPATVQMLEWSDSNAS